MKIPEIKGVNIINKDIIIDDNECVETKNCTVVSSIYNKEIDECLEMIFRNNQGATINSVVYAPNETQLYIYASKKLNVSTWNAVANDEELRNHYALAPRMRRELEKLKACKDNNDINVISVKDVVNVLNKTINDSFNKIDDNLQQVNDLINKNNEYSDQEMYGSYFDYYRNELNIYCHESKYDRSYNTAISINKNYQMDYKEIGNFEDRSRSLKNLFDNHYVYSIAKQRFIDCFNEYFKLHNLFEFDAYKTGIETVNSEFKVNFKPEIDRFHKADLKYSDSLCLYDKNTYFVDLAHNIPTDPLIFDFCITSYISPDNMVVGSCFSNVKAEYKNDADTLLSNAYIRINDCPEYIRKELYLLRRKQLCDSLNINDDFTDIKNESTYSNENNKNHFNCKKLIKKILNKH